MTRRMTSVAGAMLLAGLGGWISPTFAQGPMAPRMDVAPPPARVAPPPPPVFVPPPVAPTPPMAPVAPVMTPPPPPDRKAPTASVPATPTPATQAPVATPAPVAPTPPTTSPATPRATATAPPPYTDSQVKALRGVGVGVRAPGGGTRQVTSDSNGVVSLGKLGPGRHELTVPQKSLGAGIQPGAQPVALIGLLLPAVQKVREGERRYRTVVVRPVNDPPTLRVRIDVDANGQVSTVDPGNGIGVNVAAGDVNGDGRADIKLFEDLAKRNTSGETRLVFVAPVSGTLTANEAPINTSRSNIKRPSLEIASAGPDKPKPNYNNKPIPGVDIIVEKNPGGKAAKQATNSDGTSTLGVLTPGTHSVKLDTKKLLDVRMPGPSGGEPVQPAGILISLLIPAVAKLGQAPQPTTVEHTFPRSVLANAKELRIDVVIPDGGGSPKVSWGDGSPQTDVARDGVPVSSALRVSADVSTIRVESLSIPQTGTGGPGTPTANEAPINTSRSNIKRPSLEIASAGPDKPKPNYINNPIPGVDIIVEKNPGGKAAKQATSGDGTSTLGVLTPGTHSLKLDTKKLLDVRTPGPSGGEPAQPAGILIGLLLPAVQKLGEAPQPTTVEHAFPRSVLANAKELRIDVVIPDGGGSPKVSWGDGSPQTDVARDGVPVSSALRVSADVSTIRVQNYLSSPQTGPGGTAQPTANEAPINTTRSNIKRPSLEIAAGEPGKTSPNYTNNPIPGVDIIVEKNPGGKAAKQTTNGDGTSTLGVLTPGTHSVKLDTKKLLDVRTPGPSGGEPAQPAGILISLLIPAVAKLGQAPQPTTVEHTFPRSVLANAKELRIGIVIPDGGGSPKVNWGDGSPQTDVIRDGVLAPSALRGSSTIGVEGLGESILILQEVSTKPTTNEAAIVTTRSNIKRPSVKLPDVGVTATGPNGTQQARSDGEGWTRLGMLPVGNTVIEFSGTDLATALKKTGTPLTPTAQQNHIELLVVIAIIAIKTDGTPVAFTGSAPASAVKSLKADLRIGRDGNAMEANWGNGPQAPQEFRVEVGNSNTAFDSFATLARQAKPGEVFAFSSLQEVDTPR